MNFCSDNRAQSIQVGAVLLFGFLIIALTLYQAQGVPEENRQVEFEHSQQVGDEMVDLYTAVFETVVDGEPQPATITLGTEYNNRLFFIYPPPASGTLQTTADKPVRLHNVTAVTDTNQSFDNYWDNTTRSYEAQAITYSPNYRVLRGTADYRIEYGMLAAEYDESNTTELRLAENHQPIIDGDEIELVVIDGDLQSVDTDAESVIPERVTESTEIEVTNDSNTGLITLELPTGLGEEQWNTTDPDDILHSEQEVENVSVNDGNATIRLNSSTNYTLTIHKVDVGSGPTEPEPTYLQNVSYSGTDLKFKIRDRFHDPVDEGVDVWVFNASGDVDEKSTAELENPASNRSVRLTGVDSPCGIALDDNIGTTEAYERINATGAC
ncbi:hypothetical protein [Halohasta salina]|uniref:hypothetical protein n=1 Tax=Halohasta salina TaxID=2961621 RepID=UPI0020A3D5E7|nr:hypothetical protein [Halohasta salina]